LKLDTGDDEVGEC